MKQGKQKPPWPVRGVMVDPGRLIERHEFYFDLLENMAEWGLNTLWWHFSDDQGFMLKLDSHPELAGPHAFSKAEMRRFLAAAAKRGIDVVPEVESLGHTRFITALPEYAELADGDEFAFNAICPAHPRTLPLLTEIITEVAELFPSRYFHAGCDEVNLGDCPRCRRAGRGKPPWWLYARHVKAIHSAVRAAGKEMIIWADHVEKAPAMLKALPKDIILAHWHYYDVYPKPIRRSLAAGFRVIGCPALCRWGNVIMPNEANFENMDAMTDVFSRLRPRACALGVVNTWWTLWRGLRDAYLPTVAYTGRMLQAQSAVGKPAFMRGFAQRFFGPGAGPAGTAIWDLHRLMLTCDELRATLFDSPADMHDALKLAEQAEFARRGRRIEECLAALRKAAGKVRRHRAEFDALILAGEVAAFCCRRVGELASAVAEYRRAEFAYDRGRPVGQVVGFLDNALNILWRMREDLKPILQAVSAEWDRTRYADDPTKGLKKGQWRRADCDALLARLAQADRFAAKLTRDFARAITTYQRTGRLPGGI